MVLFFFYGKEGLKSIDIPLKEPLKVYYESIDILNDTDSVLKLSQYDIPTTDDEKCINFDKLGISFSEFGIKQIVGKKTVTISARNQREMFITRPLQNDSKNKKSLNTEISIIPLKGFIFNGKEIIFGITQQKVEILLGIPLSFNVNNLINQIHELRDGTIFKYENNKLFSIEFLLRNGLNVFYKDIDIFNDKETVSRLSEYDTPTPNNGKYMNFYKLGVLLGGFGKKRVPEKKIVILFPENRIGYYEMMFRTGGGKM